MPSLNVKREVDGSDIPGFLAKELTKRRAHYSFPESKKINYDDMSSITQCLHWGSCLQWILG